MTENTPKDTAPPPSRKSGLGLFDPHGPQLSAEDVREAFHNASFRLAPPSDAECGLIAERLTGNCNWFYRPRPEPNLKWLRVRNDVREAIALIQKHEPLPREIEKALREKEAASKYPAHPRQYLTWLLDGAQHVPAIWPEFNKRVKDARRKIELRRTLLEIIERDVLDLWRRANPERKIGDIKTPDQPATRLAVNLLKFVGIETSPEALTKDLQRKKGQKNPRSCR